MNGWLFIEDAVLQDIPYGHRHLARDCDLYFHAVLASLDSYCFFAMLVDCAAMQLFHEDCRICDAL